MSDLVALVLPLTPLQTRSDTPYLGRAAHAWFMQTIARLDPALAARLHEQLGPRPFTIWPCIVTTGADHPFLRITSIDRALTSFLLDRWLPNLSQPITLDWLSFTCGPIAQRPDQHPWAGQTTYATLVRSATERSARPGQSVPSLNLVFATPTLFRSNNLDVPLPLPTLIFDGLLQKWDCFAPAPMDADMKSWIETHLAVGRYRLETSLLAFDRDRRDVMAGFHGDCRLVFVGADPVHMAMSHTLAEFAFYAGVGRRTTMGMGQVRVLGARS